MDHQQNALEIFKAAVESVQPANLLHQFLNSNQQSIFIGKQEISKKAIEKLIVLSVGKAAAAMAQQAELLLGEAITGGLCITKHNHGLPLQKLELVEAGHPIPDENSIKAGSKLLRLIRGLTENDLVLILISGGASALMADLPPGSTLPEIQYLTSLLLQSGASIHEMNTVRKHLSLIKGGQLALRAQPAKVYALILSDVVGDNLDIIASGPTVPDSSSFAEAMKVLVKYNLWDHTPKSLQEHIKKGVNKLLNENPLSSDPCFKNTFTQIIGNNSLALKAAKDRANEMGYHVHIYKENMEGDAEQLARSAIQSIAQYNEDLPVCFLLGGETTVKNTGTGKGGRNQHFVLSALDELYSVKKKDFQQYITVLSGGTDGSDGPTDATGAIANIRMTVGNLPLLKSCLRNFDSYHFFEKVNGLIKTGPTQTNVMDIAIILYQKP